ncbi:MAG: hypothetical protein AAFX03_08485 [Pseudomonadota bacterium]
MTPQAFAKAFHDEKLSLLSTYFTSSDETAVAAEIAKMGLSQEQMETLKNVLGLVLDDTFYTILLGLDGSASIGGVQQLYSVFDESGTRIGGEGDIEAAAYEQFHKADREN